MAKTSVNQSEIQKQIDVDSFYDRLRAKISAEHPNMDLASSELLFNLIRAFSGAQNRLGQLIHRHGITMSGFNVLSILDYSSGGMPLNELGNLLLVSRANVTGLIDSLERKGLVERVDHQTDRRVFLARITDKGSKLLKSYRPSHLACIEQMGSSLTSKEKKTLTQLLTKWRRGVDSAAPRPTPPTEER